MPISRREWSQGVNEFTLTIDKVVKEYTRLPKDSSGIFYHYINRAGLEGILRSGSFRARHRMHMNDRGEFPYARNLVFESLDEILHRSDLPDVAESITRYARKNLERFLDDSTNSGSAYCACLTVSGDDPDQWRKYADNGEGFAIGFNLHQFLNLQVPDVQNGRPYIYCAPVTYEEIKQRALVRSLVEAGITDLQRFAGEISNRSEELTAFRDRIIQEIVVHLMTLIEFIKAPTYRKERELRLMLDSNDGTLRAQNVQYYLRGGVSIPYIFMNLRSPNTGRVILSEIRIGPKACLSQELTFVENLLDDLGYGSGGHRDHPAIMHSTLATD